MNTHTKRSRMLSVLLAVLLTLVLFAAIPNKVHAANALDLYNLINNFNHGGKGALSATLSGNTVTVDGDVSGVVNSLWLYIDADVRVVWRAKYRGDSGSVELIRIMNDSSPAGTFELVKGGLLVCNSPATLEHCSGDVIVNGGEIINDKSGGRAISTGFTLEGRIIINAGKVIASQAGGKAIYAGTPKTIFVNGGTVRADSSEPDSHAIFSDSGKSVIQIKGGNIQASRDAICINGENVGLYIKGGSVKSTGQDIGSAIYISGEGKGTSVRVTGGKVIANGTGLCHAVCSDAPKTVLDVLGGTLTSSGGNGGTVWLRAPDSYALVRDKGKVENTGKGAAILTDEKSASKVIVRDNAVISSQTGKAIKTHTAELTEGFIFAYYEAVPIAEEAAGEPSYGGTAIGCTWMKEGGSLSYQQGSGKDLYSSKGATATWEVQNNKGGIAYKRGGQEGFFPIAGISILSLPTPPPPNTTAEETIETTADEPATEEIPATTTPVSVMQTDADTIDATEEETIFEEISLPVEDDSMPASEQESAARATETMLVNRELEGGESNWLWLALIAVALVAVGLGSALIILLVKNKRKKR